MASHFSTRGYPASIQQEHSVFQQQQQPPTPKVHFAPVMLHPDSPPEVASSFAFKLRNSFKGFTRSPARHSTQSSKKAKAAPPPVPPVPRGILQESQPASSSSSAAPATQPLHASAPASSSRPSPKDIQFEFVSAQPQPQQQQAPPRPGTPPSLVLPGDDAHRAQCLTSPQQASSSRHCYPHHGVQDFGPSRFLDTEMDLGVPLSGFDLAKSSRIPSMRFDDLGSDFTSELERRIYAADGATVTSPNGKAKQKRASLRPAPAASGHRSHSSASHKHKGHSPPKTSPAKSDSSRLLTVSYSPKRRKRHGSLGSSSKRLSRSCPPSAPSSSSLVEDGSSSELSMPETVSQAGELPALSASPKVTIQPPTPVLDGEEFDSPPHSPSNGFAAFVPSESDKLANDPARVSPPNQSIRSIADITNDSADGDLGAPATNVAAHNRNVSDSTATPPLSPSSSADTSLFSDMTSLTCSSLGEAFSSGDVSHASPKVAAAKSFKPAHAPIIEEPYSNGEKEDEDGALQLDRMLENLHRPVTASPLAASRYDQSQQEQVPSPYQFVSGLTRLQHSLSPTTEHDDPFESMRFSDHHLSTGYKAMASPVEITSTRESHKDFAMATAKSEACDLGLALGDFQLNSPPRGRKRDISTSAGGPIYTHGREESLWDLQEAVVCMGDRIEVRGYAY